MKRKRYPSDGPQKALAPGRPSILCDELTNRMANHIRATGLSLRGTAEFFRIRPGTAQCWFVEGDRGSSPETEYFFTEITQAKRHWESTMAGLLRLGAEKNATFALAALGRRCPEWRESSVVEIVEADADPDEQRTVAALRGNAEVRKNYAAFLDSLEAEILKNGQP